MCGKAQSKIKIKDSEQQKDFLELFVSVDSGKVKLHVQLRIVAFPPRVLAGTMGVYVELEKGICGLWVWVVGCVLILIHVPGFF